MASFLHYAFLIITQLRRYVIIVWWRCLCIPDTRGRRSLADSRTLPGGAQVLGRCAAARLCRARRPAAARRPSTRSRWRGWGRRRRRRAPPAATRDCWRSRQAARTSSADAWTHDVFNATQLRNTWHVNINGKTSNVIQLTRQPFVAQTLNQVKA